MARNNNSQLYADWTTKKLKEEAKSLYFDVYVSECSNPRDILILDGIVNELGNRGIGIQTTITFN